MALVVLGFVQASAFGFVKARQDFHLFGVKIFSKGGLSPTLPMIALGLLLRWARSRWSSAGGSPTGRSRWFTSRCCGDRSCGPAAPRWR